WRRQSDTERIGDSIGTGIGARLPIDRRSAFRYGATSVQVHLLFWLLVRSWRGRFSHLEDLRAHGFLHPRITDPEEAEAVGAIGVRAGLEGAADLVDPKRIVEDLYPFRRVHVDGLVLPDRNLAAVVAHRGAATQQAE